MFKEEFKNSNENSPLQEVYILLKADTPFDLYKKFLEEDQKLMVSNSWNYNDSNLVVNKIKNILENIDITGLSEKEREWKDEILWLWHHHAISCAIKYKDLKKAKEYASKALEYQVSNKNNHNKITKLLYLLVNDKLEEAEKFIKDEIGENEKEAAMHILKSYKNNWEGY